ncbi:glycosyltransferase [Amycolatopsis alkalitolerans]|uniref:Glycosyltransferase n=1 Tax=Amycolatopsis alkalitolerans TaxID=2547244 RepID=A0A5C4LXS2_9PSEU|nr:nucleotide disphospho-sugar-binding domain-containing protein [Amycolatopsis alkalitolerans]TNC23680.1 glycosyltransferase [Amycolatopsis alkalitolerans]
MSTILAYTSPARGHLYPAVAILDELRRRGHRVAVRTLASEVPAMLARGFQAAPIAPDIEAISHDDWRAGNPRAALRRNVKVFTQRAHHDANDLDQAIRAERPDAVLVDVNAWGAVAAAEAWGGPWATFCPYPLPLPSRDVPPFGPGLPLARGRLGRMRDRLLRPIVLGTLERVMIPPINRVRAQRGLSAHRMIGEAFGRTALLLYLTAEPFEYTRTDWPDNIVMVGPGTWEPPVEPPSWLDQIDRPLVLVTTSSEFQDDARLVRTAFEALADEPVVVVATLPGGDPATVRVPANGRLATFIPHGPVLDRAVCAVTHGGMGATQKALARGVPVCAVPFGRDQYEVARRVEAARAGSRLPATRLNRDRLRAKVREAMTMAEGARRIQQAFAAAGGASAAVDAIETRLLNAYRAAPS